MTTVLTRARCSAMTASAFASASALCCSSTWTSPLFIALRKTPAGENGTPTRERYSAMGTGMTSNTCLALSALLSSSSSSLAFGFASTTSPYR